MPPASTATAQAAASPPSTLAKLLSILSPAEIAAAARLFGWMLLGMLLEMLSVGLVVPALTLMVGGTGWKSLPAAQKWLAWLGDPSDVELIMLGLAGLLGLYGLKALFVLLITWKRHAFVATLEGDVSQRLYMAYVRQPWEYHLQHNSAVLIRNLNDVATVVDTVGWMLVVVAEALALAGILALLVWFEPAGALAVAAIAAGAAWLLEWLTRRRLVTWGTQHLEHAASRTKAIQESLHGMKDMALRGGAVFIDRFTEASQRCAAVTARKSTVLHAPRLWYEFVAVAAICTLAGVMTVQGKTPRAMIPTLGLFAVAAFRILPSVNRFAIAGQMLRYNAAAIDALSSDLALAAAPQAEPLADGAPLEFKRELALENVSYRYPGGDGLALRDVTLRVPRGSAVGIVGESGAGKSTLVDIILGLLPPTSGRVAVDGSDVADNIAGWRRLLGYVPQTIYLADDTIRRNVAFGLRDAEIDDAAVVRALRAAQLDGFVASLPQGGETMVGERGVRLSGGQRQRIGIARALYHDPPVLVLDEATSALDDATERDVMASLTVLHGAKTLIIVAHRLSTLATCDMLFRLEGGRAVHAGRPAPANHAS